MFYLIKFILGYDDKDDGSKSTFVAPRNFSRPSKLPQPSDPLVLALAQRIRDNPQNIDSKKIFYSDEDFYFEPHSYIGDNTDYKLSYKKERFFLSKESQQYLSKIVNDMGYGIRREREAEEHKKRQDASDAIYAKALAALQAQGEEN